jgi:hypothetical protein
MYAKFQGKKRTLGSLVRVLVCEGKGDESTTFQALKEVYKLPDALYMPL